MLREKIRTGVVYAHSKRHDGSHALPAVVLDTAVWALGSRSDELRRAPGRKPGILRALLSYGLPAIRVLGWTTPEADELLVAAHEAARLLSAHIDGEPWSDGTYLSDRDLAFCVVEPCDLHGEWEAYRAEQAERQRVADEAEAQWLRHVSARKRIAFVLPEHPITTGNPPAPSSLTWEELGALLDAYADAIGEIRSAALAP